MRRLEQFPVDSPCEVGGETAVDTKIEVDLLCGGIGFDDDTPEDRQWLIDLRNKQKSSKE